MYRAEREQVHAENSTEEEGSRYEGRRDGTRHEGRRESTRHDGRREGREEASHSTIANSSRKYPFIDYIMSTELPPIWKNVVLDRYDGSMNLKEHIDAYVAQRTLYTTNGNIYCKVFVRTAGSRREG